MKLTKITSMMAAAVAVGFCMSAAAGDTGAGKDGKFNLNNYETQFTVNASTLTPGGTWVNQPITDAGTIVIDCEPSSSNEFTYAVKTSDPMVQCDFRLSVSPVPVTTEAPNPSTPDGGAQVAFCISTNTAAGGASVFRAYANGWKTLEGFNLNGATTYDLRITFDYKSGKYAKFSVKTTEASSYTDLVDTTDSTTKWFATGKDADGVSQYCFIGDGALTSFSTAQASIMAEKIVVPVSGGVDVVMPEEAIQKFGDGDAAAAATALATTDLNGNTKLDNYVVFGQKALDGEITADTKPVAKPSTQVDASGNIPLNLQNLDVKTVSGTSVSYQLMGADTAGGTFTAIGDPVSNAADVKIPHDTTKKVFKVRVNVNYTPAN